LFRQSSTFILLVPFHQQTLHTAGDRTKGTPSAGCPHASVPRRMKRNCAAAAMTTVTSGAISVDGFPPDLPLLLHSRRHRVFQSHRTHGSLYLRGYHHEGDRCELHLDSQTGTLIGTCTVSGTGGAQTWTTKTCSVSGATEVHDLFFKFTGTGSSNLFNFNWWQFSGPGAAEQQDGGTLPEAGDASSAGGAGGSGSGGGSGAGGATAGSGGAAGTGGSTGGKGGNSGGAGGGSGTRTDGGSVGGALAAGISGAASGGAVGAGGASGTGGSPASGGTSNASGGRAGNGGSGGAGGSTLASSSASGCSCRMGSGSGHTGLTAFALLLALIVRRRGRKPDTQWRSTVDP
jgi:MYXO-CTERM domain-containing protein